MARETARVVVNAVDNASRVLQGVGRTAGTMGKAFERSLSIASDFTIATMGAVRATKALGEALVKPIQLAAEQQRVEQQLAAVLESTEHAAGLQEDALLAMASAYQEVTKFGDEAIIGAQNILLTFTNIGGAGGIFERTTGVVLDVAQAMGSSLKEASIQLGKALNDPITGVSALGEVGITFSTQQKEVIKSLAETGRLAEAQTLILDELERQFGGSAKAARETFGGAIQSLNNAWGDLLETSGNFIVENEGVRLLIEELTQTVAGWSSEIDVLSSSTEAHSQVAEIFRDALEGVLVMIEGLIGGFAALGDVMFDAITAVAELRGEMVPLTTEQRAVADEIRNTEDELLALQSSLEAVKFVGAAEDVQYFRDQVREAEVRLRDLRGEYARVTAEGSNFREGVEVLQERIGELRERIGDLDLSADGLSESLARTSGGVMDLAREGLLAEAAVRGVHDALELFREATAGAAAAQEHLGAEISNERLEIQGLLGDLVPLANVHAVWLGHWRDLREEMVGMPWDQQLARMAEFEDALRGQVERSADFRDSLERATEATGELAEEGERAGERMQEAFGERFKEALEIVKDEYDELIAAQKRAEEEWERSVENMASRASDAFGEVIDDWLDGQASLREGFVAFGGSARDVLTDAFLGPITDADSALHQVFSSAINPVKQLGKAVNDQLIAPLISGVVEFFAQKTVGEAAAGAASQAIHAGTSKGIVATQQQAVAAMMPGLSAAASAALIATFGSAASAASLLPTIMTGAAAFGEGLAQALNVIPLAEGGFITERTPAVVGEAGPELVLPLSRPSRARELLEELPTRAPHLMGGRGSTTVNVPVSLTVMNASNLDERTLARRIAEIVDEQLGRQLRI